MHLNVMALAVVSLLAVAMQYGCFLVFLGWWAVVRMAGCCNADLPLLG
jgi:hypothetical protein